jgi:hypothetical protein
MTPPKFYSSPLRTKLSMRIALPDLLNSDPFSLLFEYKNTRVLLLTCHVLVQEI